jgi:hypothetical protein
MELKKIRNLTAREQFVVYKGKQILLPAGETLDMDSRVADLFLERCEGTVEEVLDIGGVYATEKTDDVWVANITGNPDADPNVRIKKSDKGRWYEVEIPNPNKEARTVSRVLKRGMKEVMGRSGVEALNLLPRTIKIPAYKRVKMPKHIARWFTNRVAMSGTADCMKSRAPSAFEPDDTWAVDDLRRYLQLVDSDAELGIPEWKIRKMKQGLKNAKSATEHEVFEAKKMLLRRLHFRLADPKFRLPTRQEFEEYRARDRGELVDPSDAPVDGEELKVSEIQPSQPSA